MTRSLQKPLMAAELMFWGMTLASLCGLAGCRPLARWFEQQPANMTPEDFMSDRLLRRLAEAVDRGDAAAIDAAVQAGADVNAYGKEGYRILYWAMARGQVEGFQHLLRHGAMLDNDYRDSSYLRGPSYNQAVLEKMIANEDQRFLNAALRNGLDPNYAPNKVEKRSLLFLAIWNHSHPAIETLLDAGADINWRDYSGYTPLVKAMMIRDYSEVRLLLNRGADPVIKDNHGHDLIWALKRFGPRGVRPDQRESFEKVVNELVRRGLITWDDIKEAVKPKTPEPGITVIEHAPDSEAGRSIRELDSREREANARDQAR